MKVKAQQGHLLQFIDTREAERHPHGNVFPKPRLCVQLPRKRDMLRKIRIIFVLQYHINLLTLHC